jgi:hypothetical protein
MTSILEVPEEKPAAAASGPSQALAMAGIGLGVVALGLATYLLVELRDARRQIAQLAEQTKSSDKRAKEMDLALAAVRGQTVSVAQRVGVTASELDKTAAAARELREEQRKGQAGLDALGGEVGKVKDDVEASKAAIDASKTAIEETQAQLQRAVGDLGEQSGLIARNGEEVAALKRAGLREYYEFNLLRGKSPTAIGPVAMRLRDADPKRHKFNLVLVVDDVEIEKKDKTLLEPVQFYRKGSRQLNEIVVYAVQKDRITGYLSTPKESDAAAAAK